MGETRNAWKILFGNPEGKNYLEDRGVDGRIILKWKLKEAFMGNLEVLSWH
jgi:hypothetical protein